VAVTYTDVIRLAQTARRPPARVLAALAGTEGLTGLVVSEQSLTDLLRRGECVMLNPARFHTLLPPDLSRENLLVLLFTDADVARRVRANLEAKRPGAVLWESDHEGTKEREDTRNAKIRETRGGQGNRSGRGGYLLAVNASASLLDAMGVGFDERILRAAREQDLDLVAEWSDYPGLRPEGLDFALRQARAAGVQTVLFRGGRVPGYRDHVALTAASLRRHSLHYAPVEFRPLKGEGELLRALANPAIHHPSSTINYPPLTIPVVRVHTLSPDETGALGPELAAARYVRAVKERHVRLCLVRLFPDNRTDLLGFNVSFLQQLGRGLRAAGFVPGPPTGLPDVRPPFLLAVLLALGVCAAGALLAGALGLGARAQGALFLGSALLSARLLWEHDVLARQALALAAAVVFPVLAVWPLLSPSPKAGRGSPLVPPIPIRTPHSALCTPQIAGLRSLLAATTVAVVGGLLIAGLLADPRFRLQIEMFRGVKVALVLPVILTGGIALRRHFLSAWSEEGWRAFLAAPLSRADVLGLLALGSLLGLVLLRAGNGHGALAPPWELPVRAWLDQVLFVRPRFKEVLLGGPARDPGERRLGIAADTCGPVPGCCGGAGVYRQQFLPCAHACAYLPPAHLPRPLAGCIAGHGCTDAPDPPAGGCSHGGDLAPPHGDQG
jgi:hypothetical protein